MTTFRKDLDMKGFVILPSQFLSFDNAVARLHEFFYNSKGEMNNFVMDPIFNEYHPSHKKSTSSPNKRFRTIGSLPQELSIAMASDITYYWSQLSLQGIPKLSNMTFLLRNVGCDDQHYHFDNNVLDFLAASMQ